MIDQSDLENHTASVKNTTLAKKVGLPLLSLYGLGTILGAGIYVLVGKVAATAGYLAPLSFLIAAVIAWVTALSYSQLSILFPRCAGEAVYIENAFNHRWLTLLVGVLIICTGIVSSATLIDGFIGYLKVFLPITEFSGAALVLLVLTTIALWGISESLIISGVITVIEIIGLLLVIYFCGDVLQTLPERKLDLFLPGSFMEVLGVMSGAFLAFYAFIGFEDMVNVVEEVKDSESVMPRAIIIVLLVSTLLYMLVAMAAVLSISLETLADSDAPMALLLSRTGALAEDSISVIAMLAIINGVLIQIIMASRVLFGLSSQYSFFAPLSYVSPLTRTPVIATLLIAGLIYLFAVSMPLENLARLTSFIVLIVFVLVNLALWRVGQNPDYQDRIQLRHYPQLGAGLCLVLLVFQLLSLIH